MIDVVALGELLIDFATISVDGDGYPTMAAHPGGAPANFLAALTKFGASTALLGKVGTDTFGKLLTATLQKAGIETRGLIATDDAAIADVENNGEGFTTENAREVDRVLRDFMNGAPFEPGSCTRGLYLRGLD